jgi:hypothetical protein
MGQEPFAMGPEDYRIALFFVRDTQDFCRGIAHSNDDVRNEFEARGPQLCLRLFAKGLQVVSNRLNVDLPFLLLFSVEHIINLNTAFREQVSANRLDGMEDYNLCSMPLRHIYGIQEGIRRVFAEIGRIKNVLDLWYHTFPPFLLPFSIIRNMRGEKW